MNYSAHEQFVTRTAAADVSYVYAIENTVNGGCYIGSSSNYKSRWSTHRSTLRRGKHHSFILQKAWDKYGEAAFEFKLLVVCAPKDKIFYEQRCLPLQRYNLLRTAREHFVRGGWHHSTEYKQKMSDRLKGVTPSERCIAASVAATTGKKRDAAFSQKARARQIGKSPSEVTRNRLSAAMVEARALEIAMSSERVIAAYNSSKSGISVMEACSQNGISTGTFYRHCKRLGLSLFKHPNYPRTV